MNRYFIIASSIIVSGADFFACGISMPKISYHGLGFDK